jgi:hypothetical protein
MSLQAIATPAAREPGPLATRLRSLTVAKVVRVNREIGRRSDVVGIFPNDAALLRLAGMLLLEQNDEWLVGRRYLSETSLALALALALAPDPDHRPHDQEVPQLTAP